MDAVAFRGQLPQQGPADGAIEQPAPQARGHCIDDLLDARMHEFRDFENFPVPHP